MRHYFSGETFESKSITKHEYYSQRERVSELATDYGPLTSCSSSSIRSNRSCGVT